MERTSKSMQRVKDVLDRLGLELQVVEFAESTRTSQEAANMIGCQVGQIAKTLLFKTKQSARPVCVIASGINRVDEKKIQQLEGEKIEKANADEVLKFTGYVIGGVAPVGFQTGIQPYIDEDLFQYEEIWAAAGTPHSVFKLTPEVLVQITGGQVVQVKK
ncbi:YbaK/EbsC family protein [Brevibacillus sp. B_LB10_24]|uniref:YbaK/EbsC family protein n=1 Tax=Brevibacillus sp. B_LB10_24 TaxID=3380645 RepID=UPI0038BC4271